MHNLFGHLLCILELHELIYILSIENCFYLNISKLIQVISLVFKCQNELIEI